MPASSPDPRRVLAAVRVFHAHASLADEALADALHRAGFSDTEAELALAFLPLAFGRVVLRRLGVTHFAPQFLVAGPDGRWHARALASEPWYRAAEELALAYARQRQASADVSPDVPSKVEYQAVLQRSGEVAAAQELLEGGGQPADLGFVEPQLMRLSLDMLAAGHHASWP